MVTFWNLTKNLARNEKVSNLVEMRTKTGPERNWKKEKDFGEKVAWEKWLDSYFGWRQKSWNRCKLKDTAWLCMPQLGLLHLLRLLWPPKFLEVWVSGLKISLDILFSDFPEETQMVTPTAHQIENLHCSHLMTAI